MSMVSTSFITQSYVNYTSKKQSAVKYTGQQEAAQGSSSQVKKQESAVADFIKRNPSHKKGVMEMVQAGESVRKACGVEGIDTSSMSMGEYKAYISSLLGKIPFAPSRPYDEETVFISEEGWEQMKNDPDYEAWVLGYTKINRSVADPFFGMGSAGSFAIEHFGASIDEHNGHGYSKLYGGSASAARGMYQAESRGGMSYRASKSPDIAKKLEQERIKEKRQQKEKRERMLKKEQESHRLMMQQWARRSAKDDFQPLHQINQQQALAFYESGFVFQN